MNTPATRRDEPRTLAYTIKQTAAQLNVSTRTVEGMIHRGELPINRFGATKRAIRVAHSTLQEYLDKQRKVWGAK